MFFVMAIAGMVCTALSVSGQTITDLKTGYWLGSTPAMQERVKFLGILASSVAAALTIVLLAKTFQFGEAAPGGPPLVLARPPASTGEARAPGFKAPPAPPPPPLRGGGGAGGGGGAPGIPPAFLPPGHVPAAGAEHAGTGGRLPLPLAQPALRGDGWRGGA